MVLSPIDSNELRQKLNEGTVQFAFKKLNGDLRTATGTTNLDNIPLDNHPTGNGKSSPMVVTFFDVTKQAWRSVSTSQEIFIAE